MNIDAHDRSALRTAAFSGLAFDLLYVIHHLLQGLGPDDTSAAGIGLYNATQRSRLLLSEIALGLALLAAIGFVAALPPVLRRAGQETLATAVVVSGSVFVAMGFLSQAAETALVGVADKGNESAVRALNELQGRTPNVWTITALAVIVSLAALRTGLLPRWLGIAGLVAAGVFALGSIFSVLGRKVEGTSSLYGNALFVLWLAAVSIGLLRAAGPVPTARAAPAASPVPTGESEE
jgi:Domain of unknown function (DUF4386)